MPYSIHTATEADLLEMTEVMMTALLDDPCWQGMKGTWTYEEEFDFTLETLRESMANGFQSGTYQCWKVIDENGKIIAWAGLGTSVSITEDQKNVVETTYRPPAGRNPKILEFFRNRIFPSLQKNGYDNTKDFQRQNIMVRPEYQRKGLGRLLTEKCNEIADAAGAATYVRAQYGAARLFVQMGYEVLERIDFDLSDFGAEGDETNVFIMKREPGAREQKGRSLN